MIAALSAFAARRDRIVVPVWVYALLASGLGTVYSYRNLYPTRAERLAFARGVVGNSSVTAFYGKLYGPSTVGGLTAWRVGALGSVLVAVMSVLLVVRHSRADEEQQRLELLRSSAIGRSAPLAAALLVTAATDLTVAVLVAAGMVAFGLGAGGAVAFGLAWLSVGLCFASVAALCAQVVESSRAANGLALSLLAVAYLLRAAGDAGDPGWLGWLSPVGWAEQIRPYAGDRWLVLLLPAAVTVLVGAAAFAVNGRRDLGAGVLATRPGPARAGRALAGSFGLAWRVQRGTVVAWTVGFALAGGVLGLFGSSVDDLVGDNERTRSLLSKLGGHGGLADAYLATVIDVLGLLAGAYVVLVLLRMRDEETSGRADLLLAGPLRRLRWAAGHTALCLAGAALVLAVGGLAMGATFGDVPAVLGATMAQLAAVAVVAGVTALLYAVSPRWAAAGWGVLGWCVLLQELGPLVRAPRWLMDASPYTQLPNLPGGAVSASPLVALSVVAAALVAVGAVLLRGRDLG